MFVFTHRNPEMQIDKQHTALVLADMQNEFLEEKTGTYYELIADALKKRNVVANLEELSRRNIAERLFSDPILADSRFNQKLHQVALTSKSED